MEWKQLGSGAALALCVDRVMVAMVTGPDDSGYSVTFRPSGIIKRYPDLHAAKAAAERDAGARQVSHASAA